MARPQAPNFRELPRASRLFIAALLAAALAAIAVTPGVLPGPELDVRLLVIALALGALANLLEVLAPGHYSLQPNLVFFFWGAALLPAWAIGALAVTCFVPGAIAHRFRWYMVSFNVANYALAGLAANALVNEAGGVLGERGSVGLHAVAVLAAAAVAFLALNYVLIAFVVSVSRRRPLRASMRALAGGLPLDMSLAMTGACLAALWVAGPFLVLLAVGPMVLAYRALLVPLLKHKSRTDPKTGLYNSEHFEAELADALRSARKEGAELSVAIFDLDHLRAVNNRFGHLAGDQLIRGTADLLAALSPEGALAARFGGEEFCLLMPDMGPTRAREVVERVRAAVQAMSLRSDGEEEFAITISAGVASHPEHGDAAEALMTSADAALYDAKLAGRNRVRVALPTDSTLSTGLRSPTKPIIARSSGAQGEPHDRSALSAEQPEPSGSATREQPAAGSGSPRAVWWFVGALVLGATTVAAVTLPSGVRGSSLAFVLLIFSVIALDIVRIDVFERGKISPASVATLALAFLFGPAGPLAAEASIATIRAVRRERPIKLAFDFGALTLAGTAAALVYQVINTGLGLPLLGAAAGGLAYYAVNIPLLSIIVSLNQREGVRRVWQEQFAWLWPHFVAFGLLAGTFALTEHKLGLYAFVIFGVPLLTLWTAEAQYLKRSRASVTELRHANQDLERANADLRKLLESNEQLLTRVHRSYLATITSLARTIDAKDPYTGGHTERVAEFSRLIAIELGFDEEQLRAVEVGAVIHDIGKIGVPDQILLKEGRLDESEFAEMRRHPEISSYIIGELDLPAIVKEMVRSHHERFDGSGYPDGLRGEEIPLGARVLAVADALDAMTTDRPYRRAMSLQAARAELDTNAGVQFCPRVVTALTRCMESDPGLWGSLCAGADSEVGAPDKPATYAVQSG